MVPRYWWQDRDDEADAEVLLASDPTSPPPVRTGPRPQRPDLVRLRSYRAELIRKAARMPRSSPRRRAIEKRLIRITADLLRAELGR